MSVAAPETWREGLLRLAAIQAFLRLGRTRDGMIYGPGFFKQDWSKVVSVTSRKVILRLARRLECVVCDAPIPPDGHGDHVVPKSAGGTNDVSNFLPLCVAHNSSKHKGDLLAWWLLKGYPLERLSPDVICQYARAVWVHLKSDLDAPIPRETARMIAVLEQRLPTERHRQELARVARQQADEARCAAIGVDI